MMYITDYKLGDEKQILQLFEKTFGKPMSREFWKWRFLDNPTNKVMIKLMWDNDLLIGHYAASPVMLNYNGELILTALSMTTMTHPDYAGQGIFSKLAEDLYQSEFKKNKLKAVWGFPNNNSHYAFIKNLQWKNLEVIPTFSLAIGKIKDSDHSHIESIDSFSSSHKLAVEKVTRSYQIKLEKSIDFLNWRYLNHPENKYAVFEWNEGDLAYFAVAKVFPSFEVSGKFEIDILELIVPNETKVVSAFLYAIKNFYSSYDLLRLNMWIPLNDPKHLTLEKLGFVNSTPLTYFGVKVIDPNFSQLNDTKLWDYSFAYSDVY